MQYSIVGNDIALIMHYRALLKRSGSQHKQIFKIAHQGTFSHVLTQ